jgi:hypothetical protein
MKRTTLALAILGALVAGCNAPTPTQPQPAFRVPGPSRASAARVVHRITVGSNDACVAQGAGPKGCDGNFSLTALVHADGTVTGQWEDEVHTGAHALSIDVDCAKIVGNVAVVGGVIKNGLTGDPYFDAGMRVWAAVADNGQSAKDPPDQIGYTYNAGSYTCSDADLSLFPLYDLNTGQVRIQ